MPVYKVRAPDGSIIKVNGPEDATEDEILSFAEQNYRAPQEKPQTPEPKFKDYLKDIPKAVGRGAAGLGETAAIGASALLPEEYEQKARKGIESLAAPAREYLAPSSQEVGESVSSQIASGLGSTLPFFAAAPFGLAGALASGAGAVAAGAGESRMAAEKAGATPEQRSRATLLGAPIGLLDVIAPEIKPFGHILTTAAARGGVEGLTEAAQQVAQNLIARGVYNPNQEITVGSGEQGAYGAGAGALASLIVDLTLGHHAHVDLGGQPKEAGQGPVNVLPPSLATLPTTPSGFDANQAAALRAEAEQAEKERLASQQAPLMLGYSPLPGVLPVTEQGQVALTPDQLLAERYKPQPTEATKQQLALQQDQEQEAQSIKDLLDQKLAIRQAEMKDRIGAQKKSTVGPWAPEEKEAMGIPVEEKKTPQYKAVEHPENKGFILDKDGNPQLADLAQGAQKFKNKAQADEAKGNLADYKTIAMPGGGFALSPKTESELKKEGASKLRFANVSEAGMPMAVHEMIASEGGLSADAAKNANVSQQRIGNRYLVAGKGKGVTADRVRDLLESNGYVQPGEIDDNQALQMVADSIKKPIYTAEGTESVAAAEREKQTKEAEKADLAEQLKSPVAEEMGYHPFEATIGEAHDALTRVKDAGLDADAILEQAHEDTKFGSDQDFHRRVVDLSNQKLGTVGERAPVGEAPTMETIRESRNPDVGMNRLDATHFSGVKNGKQLLEKYAEVAKDSGLKDLAGMFLQSNRAPDIGVNFVKAGDKIENPQVAKSLNNNALAVSATGEKGSQVYYRSDSPDAFSEDVLIHEVLHSMTEGALARNPTLRKELTEITSDVTKGLREMADMATNPQEKARLRELLDFWTGAVQQKPGEMLAYSLTSPTFRDVFSQFAADGRPFAGYRTEAQIEALRARKEKPVAPELKSKAPKEMSMWQRIVDFARRLMGLPAKYQKQFEEALAKHQEALKQHEKNLDQYQREEREHRTMTPLKQRLEGHLKRLLEDTEKHGVSMKGETVSEARTTPERTQVGNDAMDIVHGMGRQVAAPDPTLKDKLFQRVADYKENPKEAREQAYGAFRKFADSIETMVFSSDAALNNQIRRAIMESNAGQEHKLGALLNTSLSQTVHSDAVAGVFLREGNIKYNEEIHKWEGVKDENNIINLSKALDEIANKHGLTKEEIELIAHTAFEARRTNGLIRHNDEIDQKVSALRAQAKMERQAGRPVAAHAISDKASKLLSQKKNVMNMTPAQLQGGLQLYKMFPELSNVTKIWNGIRENALDKMVQSGLYTQEEAEMLMDVAEYVPFCREEQLEENKGPKEFLKSLSVQADKRLKGSAKPVNDIFDNMVRWTQYAINRSIRNRSAQALADTAVQCGFADVVADPKDGENVVSVWKDGKQTYYSMQDPLFMQAFKGIESVSIPTVKFFSKAASVLRNSVVLYPLFSVTQVPQDAFAAMFSSGLKPQYALSIPVRAVKEFIQTMRGKSKAHEELKNVGAAGVRDFTSSIIRADTEILSGLKQEKGVINTVFRWLGNVAMAGDNAVRQAVYEASMAQGLSKAEALEKSFEIFNVRRRGNSAGLALAGQVIPFFNAYLTAQHVAYRTLTGVGISPTEREAAFKTLLATTGSVMALSLLYAMMNADDKDYINKPTPTRDRLLMIPGTGVSIPLRSDLFLLPKAITEHLYMLITDNGYEDGAKFRASMSAILKNAIFSPTPVPQAVKPLAEAIMNYDFFQQKPLVGIYQQKKEVGRQFDESTSELSKLLGKTGMISPIVADHLIRGMFGSMGGLTLYMTNPILSAMSNTPRPSMNIDDALATIPGASAFVTKQYEVGLRKDFYALKEATDRVAATVSDMKEKSPHEIADYLSDPENRNRYQMSRQVNQISNELTAIRKKISVISNLPADKMSDDEKMNIINKLRESEERRLKGVNLKRLREQAGL